MNNLENIIKNSKRTQLEILNNFKYDKFYNN